MAMDKTRVGGLDDGRPILALETYSRRVLAAGPCAAHSAVKSWRQASTAALGIACTRMAGQDSAGTFASMPDHYYSVEHYVARGAPRHPGLTEMMVHPGNPHRDRYAAEMARLTGLVTHWALRSFRDLPQIC